MIDTPTMRPPSRLAKALYQKTSLPFRLVFNVAAKLRASKAPECLNDKIKDEYIAGHTGNFFAEQWLHAYPRVFSLMNHFSPPSDPAGLKTLSIGPRTEIEGYYLWLFFGFSWENWTGLDLVATTDKIKVGDISKDIPFPDNSFDVIVTSHCLEKSRDPQRTRDEILRIAKNGARICVAGNRPDFGTDSAFSKSMFKDGVYGFIDMYRIPLERIEFMNARSSHGFEIIFRVEK